jgi:hypothetical protein
MRQPPVRYGRHRSGEIHGDCAALMQKAQKATQRRDHQLGIASSDMASLFKNKPMNIVQTEFVKARLLAPETVDQKASHYALVVRHGNGLEPAL